jgi:tyrosyl-tRNA synthetase
MAHETFRKRWDEGLPLTVMELMYPLLQAYDSVAVEADVEFGGTDQKFNNLAGRQLQTSLGLPPQDVFLVPLLEGTDGRKMSKSFGNTMDLTTPPDQMYGKAMSISDAALVGYLTLASEIPDPELEEIRHQLVEGSVNPRDIKMRLARDIVRQFHGPEASRHAEAEFVRIFQQRQLPSEIQTYELPNDEPLSVVQLLRATGLAESNTQARRLISQGGVSIDDERVQDVHATIEVKDGVILRVGKRKFARVVRGKT